MRGGAGTGQAQARVVIGAAAWQVPATGPVPGSLRAAPGWAVTGVRRGAVSWARPCGTGASARTCPVWRQAVCGCAACCAVGLDDGAVG
jgi:hypothetical protein